MPAPEKRNPRQPIGGAPGVSRSADDAQPTQRQSTPRRGPLKWRRILGVLADGTKLTRMDAEHIGDHCLPTTVTRIQREGVRVERKIIRVEGRFGSKAYVAEYWLSPNQQALARRILGRA